MYQPANNLSFASKNKAHFLLSKKKSQNYSQNFSHTNLNILLTLKLLVTEERLEDWKERIVVDPKVLVGKPFIRGTRISVEFILDLLANDWSIEPDTW
jgi:hypothetical protein